MRRAAVTVALSTALILAAAGCSATPTTTVASSAAQPATEPGKALAAAVAKTTGVNLKVEISTSTGDHFFGNYDSASHIAALRQAPGGADVTITVTPTVYFINGLNTA